MKETWGSGGADLARIHKPKLRFSHHQKGSQNWFVNKSNLHPWLARASMAIFLKSQVRQLLRYFSMASQSITQIHDLISLFKSNICVIWSDTWINFCISPNWCAFCSDKCPNFIFFEWKNFTWWCFFFLPHNFVLKKS